MITVVVADDQPLVRAGLVGILELAADIEVVGQASDGLEAVHEARRHEPDVVLMDLRMPRMDGIEATRLVTQDTAARVLALTTFDLDEYVVAALRAGASGFLLKDATPDELCAAVRVVSAGDALIAPRVTRRLLDHFADAASRRPAPLPVSVTDRERDVLDLLAQGLSNAEIAARLRIGTGTVKTHVSHLLTKLDVRDRLQLALRAAHAGLGDGT